MHKWLMGILVVAALAAAAPAGAEGVIPKEYLQGPDRFDPVWAEQMKADPAVGTPVTFPDLVTLDGQTVAWPYAGKVVMLLYKAGGVVEWLINDARFLALNIPAGPRVAPVTVFAAPLLPEAVAPAVSQAELGLPFLFDSTGALGARLNLVDHGRLYIIGADGRLLFIENPYDPVPVLVQKAISVLNRALGQPPAARLTAPQSPPEYLLPSGQVINPELADGMKTDPKVGAATRFPGLKTLAGAPLSWPHQGRVVVLLYGSGEKVKELASKAKAVAGVMPPDAGLVAVNVLRGPGSPAVQQALAAGGRPAACYSDPTGMLGKALNAVGDSRLYVVGRDGKLLFMENPYEPPETVLKNAQAAMRQGLAAK